MVSSLEATIGVCCLFSLYCFVSSQISRNHSVVDRAWSILPFLYAWIFNYFHPSPKLTLMAILATLWGCRLTFNFWRRGGYSSGGEDYRWPIIKQKVKNKCLFTLFNLTFISFYQNFLLFLLVLPSYFIAISSSSKTQLSSFDLTNALLFLFTLAMETLADQQQWQFHLKKAELKQKIQGKEGYSPSKQEENILKGFCTSGLFQYPRHPNFFCEISIWYIYYLFSVESAGLLNFSLLGAVLLNLLFMGSTPFTESITSKKYPLYGEYQKTTSRLIPWFSTKLKSH